MYNNNNNNTRFVSNVFLRFKSISFQKILNKCLINYQYKIINMTLKTNKFYVIITEISFFFFTKNEKKFFSETTSKQF